MRETKPASDDQFRTANRDAVAFWIDGVGERPLLTAAEEREIGELLWVGRSKLVAKACLTAAFAKKLTETSLEVEPGDVKELLEIVSKAIANGSKTRRSRAQRKKSLLSAKKKVESMTWTGAIIWIEALYLKLFEDESYWGPPGSVLRETLGEILAESTVDYEEFRRARDRLVESNYRLVIYCAKHHAYTKKKFSLIDIIQDGVLGLMIAASRYDSRKGYRFSTYAMNWIRQAQQRCVQKTETSSVYIPIHVQEKTAKMLRQGLVPDVLDRGGNAAASLMSFGTVSLDQEVANQDEPSSTTIEDFLKSDQPSPTESFLEKEKRDKLQATIDAAISSPRNRDILRLRYGIDSLGAKMRTLEEVGSIMGITRERVRQIETKCIKALRHPQIKKRLNGLIL